MQRVYCRIGTVDCAMHEYTTDSNEDAQVHWLGGESSANLLSQTAHMQILLQQKEYHLACKPNRIQM